MKVQIIEGLGVRERERGRCVWKPLSGTTAATGEGWSLRRPALVAI